MKKENLNNKIDDLKAHLEVIHSSIREQNKTIEDLNSLRKNLLSEIEKESLDLSNIKKEKEDSLVTIDIHNKKISNDIRTLEENKSSFEKTVKLILADIEAQKNKINSEELSANQRLTILKDEIENTKFYAGKLSMEITTLLNSISEQENTKSQLDKNVQELNEKIHSLETDLEIKTREYQNKLIDQKLDLDNITSIIEEEKNKIRGPLELIKRREDEIVIKEKQLQILTNRAKKVWDKLYPGQEINI